MRIEFGRPREVAQRALAVLAFQEHVTQAGQRSAVALVGAQGGAEARLGLGQAAVHEVQLAQQRMRAAQIGIERQRGLRLLGGAGMVLLEEAHTGELQHEIAALWRHGAGGLQQARGLGQVAALALQHGVQPQAVDVAGFAREQLAVGGGGLVEAAGQVQLDDFFHAGTGRQGGVARGIGTTAAAVARAELCRRPARPAFLLGLRTACAARPRPPWRAPPHVPSAWPPTTT